MDIHQESFYLKIKALSEPEDYVRGQIYYPTFNRDEYSDVLDLLVVGYSIVEIKSIISKLRDCKDVMAKNWIIELLMEKKYKR